jgi:hypothetical protein
MKTRKLISGISLLLLFSFSQVAAQEDFTIVAPTSEVAEWLDLNAVAELFKDAETIEDFENDLNDPDIGINNLDLNEDGYVDYIRVVEQVSEYTHLIILQVLLGDDEFQDIATIEIEKSGEEECNLQVHGNEVFYGQDYYVTPTYVHVYRWPIITWIYRPVYRPYRSVYYYGYYPRWWKPYRPVARHVYHTRTVRYTRRATFEASRVSRVKSVHRVNYKPRSSTLVRKNVKVIPSKQRNNNAVRKVDRKSRTNKNVKAVKKTYKTSPNRTTRKTTVKRSYKNPNKKIKKTTIRKSGRKPTAGGKSTTVKKSVKRSGNKSSRKASVKRTVNKPTKSKSIKKPSVKKSNKSTTNKKKKINK